MEDRRGKIIEYVKGNSRCTKTEVIKDMEKKGIGSIKTIHPIIIDLLNEGILLVLKNRPNSQIHRLIINDKNEFNKIYNSFSEIEKIIEKLIDVGPKTLPLNILVRLVSTYTVPAKALVDYLLIRINNQNHSEKDAFILNKKAINLMGKIDNLPYYSHNWMDEINSRIRFVEHSKLSLKVEFEKVPPDVNEWFDIMIDELKKFKKEFLGETKQKTKEP